MSTEKESYKEWLDSLSTGDEVAFKVAYTHSDYAISKVARRTKNYIIVGDLKFDSSDGWRARSGSWDHRARQLLPVTDEVLDSVERSKLRAKVSNLIDSVKVRHLKVDALERLAGALESAINEMHPTEL